MTLQAVTDGGRLAAESRMLDTWTIGTDMGWAYDPDADDGKGADVQTVTPLFTTSGRMKVTTTQVREVEAGGRTIAETRRELHIPVGSEEVPVNAVAQCTAVHATSDPTLIGTIVRLSGAVLGSQTTARRLEVIEVLS
jgi:hypothetical protein